MSAPNRTVALARPILRGGAFFDNRDLVLALASQLAICAPALAGVWWAALRWHWSLFFCAVAFWVLMMLAAVVFLRILRQIWPLRPGRYCYAPRDPTTYVWTLHSFVCATNLGIFYNHPSLLPSPAKKIFYRALGAQLGAGHMMIGGRLTDPYLITVESGAVVGGDCWLLAHAMARFETSVLILGPITIRREAIIGAASLLMPGVTVEAGAVLRAMSYVPMNTTIPRDTEWGGNPAQPRERRRPMSSAAKDA